MTVIQKYEIADVLSQGIHMPLGASIITVTSEAGTMYLWAEADPTAPVRTRSIIILGEGDKIPQRTMQFIGAVQHPLRWGFRTRLVYDVSTGA